jgi:putative tricarboxylic transport membrane protein
MDVLSGLMMGFDVALQPKNLFFCFVGVLTGTLVGVLPGLGPMATISLLLPVTFYMDPVSAIIMLAGIYYGAMYGGSTTSILVNLPGEAASVVTCIDGYQMARKGRAGVALGISALGSFIGGTAGIVGLMLVAPPLSEFALRFGPPEYFALTVLGLTLLSYLSSGPMSRAFAMAGVGLFLSTIGVDSLNGATRFTFDTVTLLDGVNLIPVVMGIYGLGEVLHNLDQKISRDIFAAQIGRLLPTRKDWADAKWPILRGTAIGFLLGLLPGGGAIIASFVSYATEKRLSKTPEKFGSGMIAGVAGPETANNAATSSAFIPLLTLGLPANAVMAILMGALMIHGVRPSPTLIQEHGDLFWGVVASMYLGNVMLVILNLPLVGIWVRVLRVRYALLMPMILLFCVIGAYTMKSNVTDIYLMALFGIVGYLMKKYRYDAAPLVLAFVLGPLLEESLRRSLLTSQGSSLIFFQRPISAAILALAIVLVASSLLPAIKRRQARLKAIAAASDD